MTAVLLSVKPQFARRLLSGTKTAEVRRRFPELPSGTVVYLYASSPMRAVIGVLKIRRVHTGTPQWLWPTFGKQLDISKEYFHGYLAGRDAAAVIELQRAEQWERPVALDDLRTGLGVQAPQSYRYLSSELEQALRRLSAAG